MISTFFFDNKLMLLQYLVQQSTKQSKRDSDSNNVSIICILHLHFAWYEEMEAWYTTASTPCWSAVFLRIRVVDAHNNNNNNSNDDDNKDVWYLLPTNHASIFRTNNYETPRS